MSKIFGRVRALLSATLIVLACYHVGFAAVYVKVAPVSRRDIPIYIHALGSLTAGEAVTLSAQVAGRISAVYFKDGQSVEKGMPVIQLDHAKAAADYASQLAALHLSQRIYERSKLLLNQAVSEQALEQAKAKLSASKAQLQVSQIALDQKQVSAPFTGLLGKFLVSPGDYVLAGQPLVTLVNAASVHVNFNLAQDKLGKLKLNQMVKVQVNAYPKQVFIGTVNYISPSVNANTRSIAIQALIPNKQHLLKPGMFVKVAQKVSVIKSALVLPEMAVNADAAGYYVYVVSGTHVKKVSVTLGTRLSDSVQIRSGLKVGDRVVVAGVQKLSPNALITLTPPKGAAAS